MALGWQMEWWAVVRASMSAQNTNANQLGLGRSGRLTEVTQTSGIQSRTLFYSKLEVCGSVSRATPKPTLTYIHR